MIERPQSLGEEIANSVSHGVALLAAVVSVPFLIAAARHASVEAGSPSARQRSGGAAGRARRGTFIAA